MNLASREDIARWLGMTTEQLAEKSADRKRLGGEEITPACRFGSLLAKGDLDAVEVIVRRNFGIEDPAVPVRLWVAVAAGLSREVLMGMSVHGAGRGCFDWSEGTWLMWFRNRLDLLGAFSGQEGKQPSVTDGFVTAVLHVGFIYLEETEEMLERLNHYERANSHKALASTSKVFSTIRKPVPIDRVAARGMAEGGHQP